MNQKNNEWNSVALSYHFDQNISFYVIMVGENYLTKITHDGNFGWSEETFGGRGYDEEWHLDLRKLHNSAMFHSKDTALKMAESLKEKYYNESIFVMKVSTKTIVTHDEEVAETVNEGVDD